VDYKSSPVHVKNVKAGKVFQLALYALAAEAIVLPGERCEDALYLPVGHDKNPAVALSRTNPKARWDDRIELARRAVADAVAGIRAGRFHPTLASTPCARCSDQKVCRFERARIQRKLKL
jgi:RecB family exonuclease